MSRISKLCIDECGVIHVLHVRYQGLEYSGTPLNQTPWGPKSVLISGVS